MLQLASQFDCLQSAPDEIDTMDAYLSIQPPGCVDFYYLFNTTVVYAQSINLNQFRERLHFAALLVFSCSYDI